MSSHRRILALPGTLCAPAIFDPLSSALGPDATVDAISWMTFDGPWELPPLASAIAGTIVEGGAEPVVLVGHSTGGAIALQLVLDYPHLVAGLVFIGTGPNMHGHGDVDAIIRTIETNWGRDLFATILDRSFAEELESSIREQFLDYAAAVDPRAATDVLTSQRDTDFLGRLPNISVPVVVVHGRRDPTRTVEQARAFADALCGAPLHVVDCGHSAMYEKPDAVARLIRELL